MAPAGVRSLQEASSPGSLAPSFQCHPAEDPRGQSSSRGLGARPRVPSGSRISLSSANQVTSSFARSQLCPQASSTFSQMARFPSFLWPNISLYIFMYFFSSIHGHLGCLHLLATVNSASLYCFLKLSYRSNIFQNKIFLKYIWS